MLRTIDGNKAKRCQGAKSLSFMRFMRPKSDAYVCVDVSCIPYIIYIRIIPCMYSRKLTQKNTKHRQFRQLHIMSHTTHIHKASFFTARVALRACACWDSQLLVATHVSELLDSPFQITQSQNDACQ